MSLKIPPLSRAQIRFVCAIQHAQKVVIVLSQSPTRSLKKDGEQSSDRDAVLTNSFRKFHSVFEIATTFYETEISGGEFFFSIRLVVFIQSNSNADFVLTCDQAVRHEIQKTSGLIRSLFCFTLYNVQFSLNVDNLTASVMLK